MVILSPRTIIANDRTEGSLTTHKLPDPKQTVNQVIEQIIDYSAQFKNGVILLVADHTLTHLPLQHPYLLTIATDRHFATWPLAFFSAQEVFEASLHLIGSKIHQTIQEDPSLVVHGLQYELIIQSSFSFSFEYPTENFDHRQEAFS